LHVGDLSSLAFGTTPGGQLLLASAGDDQAVRLWDPVNDAPSKHADSAISLRSSISAMAELQLAPAS